MIFIASCRDFVALIYCLLRVFYVASGFQSNLSVEDHTKDSLDTRNDVQHLTTVPAGIYFRISQKGVDYITSLATRALPDLLENAVLPKIDHPDVKISKLTIKNFTKPTLNAKFVNGTGVSIDIRLPKVTISAIYDASTFFATYVGKFYTEVQNLTIIMQVHYDRDEKTMTNYVTVPICNVSKGSIRILFAGDMSTYLNLMRSTIEEAIVTAMGNEFCGMPVTIARFFEHQKRQFLMTTVSPSTTNISPTLSLVHGEISESTSSTNVDDSEHQFYTEEDEDASEDNFAAMFAAELCANDHMIGDYDSPGWNVDNELKVTAKRRRHTTGLNQLRSQLLNAEWSPNLTLLQPPVFTDEDVLFGLDGGVVLHGDEASTLSRPKMLNISALGNQMFGLLISEYVPNSFFYHVHTNKLGNIEENFNAENLPKFLRLISKLFCATCQLQLSANLTDQPEMHVSERGVQLDIEGEVQINFVSKRKRINLVSANCKFDITIQPYLQYSRIYGDVALAGTDIKIKWMGLGGLFHDSIRKALNVIMPKKLWPKIKKRLRFAVTKRGIRLPVVCGLELERPSLRLIDHALIVDTDFSYDLPRFVRKLKAYINAKAETGET